MSRQAREAFEAGDWKRGRELMREAVDASKNCQELIGRAGESAGAPA